ncbi:lysine-rich arabinogalactan protein 19-like [Vitis riparia]|uniref:lysine-rich arabinogalactan protein 19-like n=1 Tax=Vitis riparia TaxID=96939 RepID=UPI00155B38BB|nr:lysine-rich arabinogalactan protein 19-like [Vitis riparia]
MAKTRGAHVMSLSASNPRPRASPVRDSTSKAPQAFATPPSEGKVPSSPLHRRYEMRRPPTTPKLFTLDKWNHLTAYVAPLRAPDMPAPPKLPEDEQPPQAQQVEIPTEIIPPAPVAPSTMPTPEATSFAPPTMPQAPPVVPATSAPPPSKSFITISSSEFRGLCHTLQTLSTTQSVLT